MSLTGIKTRPLLAGTLASLGPWASLFARSGFRVYPFQLGAMVRAGSTGTTVLTDGLGDFRQNDYVIVCSPVAYGDSTLFQPVLSKITKITSDPTAATDDALTISPAVAVSDGDYLLNIGADGSGTPLASPNYDGSLLTLYTDPVGNTANAADYLLTGENGHFFGWLESTLAGPISVVDLFITNSSGVPQLVLPFTAVGPSVGGAESNLGGVTVQPVSGNNAQGPINAAIAAVSAAGGGIVQLAPGTFNISSAIFIKSNIWLRGSGQGATTVKLAATFVDIVPATGNLEHLYGMISAGDRGSEYTFTNPIVNAHVSDMGFDYNSLWCYGAIKVGKANDFLAENLLLDAHSHVEAGNPLKFGIEIDPTATTTTEGVASGRITVRSNTFKGFADFNSNVISITGSTTGSNGFLVTDNIFDTCVAFCVATPNGHHENIVITNNRFYACSHPVNLEGTNPNYNRSVLISDNVMLGFPLTAGPSGYSTMGKIAIWLFLASPGVKSSTVHYAIQITNNIIRGYQEILHGTGGHLRFANNFCYDWGMGPSGGSGLVLGQAAGPLDILSDICIEDNYFYQTTPRIASGIHAAINLDTTNALAVGVTFTTTTATLASGSWGSYSVLAGSIVYFVKTGDPNDGVIATVQTVADGVLTATAAVFQAGGPTSGFSVATAPIDNIFIRRNTFNGFDVTAGLCTQHAIMANVIGSNWEIVDNWIRGSTNWPMRFGGSFPGANGMIARNTMVNCGQGAVGATAWITFGTGVARNIFVLNNVAIDNVAVLAPPVIFTTSTITRQTGDWFIDGFSVNTVVTFTKGGGANNNVSGTITALTPLVMTVVTAPFTPEGNVAAPAAGYTCTRPSRLARIFSTNNVSGSSFIVAGNVCPDATVELIGTGATLVQQGITQGILTASTFTSINGVAQTSLIPTNEVIPFNSSGSNTVAAAPTLSDGYKGQVVTLINIDTIDTTTFQDQGSLPGSNLILATPTVALAPREFLRLYFDGTDWIEISRSQASSKNHPDLQSALTYEGEVLVYEDEVLW